MTDAESAQPDGTPPAASIAKAPSRARRIAWLVVRIGVTIGAFVYLLSIVDLHDLAAAFGRLSAGAMVAAIALTATNILVASYRWRVLLSAYGAPHRPPFLRLTRLYFVGFFYNTFLPGAVGGDVVRGVATREAFGATGMASALTVVFVERVLGLSGLLLLSAIVFGLHPMAHVDGIFVWGAVGLAAAFATVIGIAAGRRLSGVLPGFLGRLAASLPAIHSFRHFFLALVLSVGTQSLVALTGHVLIASLDAHVGVADSLVIVPVAAAAAYFPITVAGAGAREAAFVHLYGAIGVARPVALAASLLLLGAQLIVAAFGGLLALAPVSRGDTSS